MDINASAAAQPPDLAPRHARAYGPPAGPSALSCGPGWLMALLLEGGPPAWFPAPLRVAARRCGGWLLGRCLGSPVPARGPSAESVAAMLAEAARLEAGEPGIRARLDAASAGEAAAMPWRLRSDVRAGYGFEVFDGGRIGFGVRYRLVTGGRLKADEGWLDLRPLRPGEDGPSALEASLRSCRLL